MAGITLRLTRPIRQWFAFTLEPLQLALGLCLFDLAFDQFSKRSEHVFKLYPKLESRVPLANSLRRPDTRCHQPAKPQTAAPRPKTVDT